MLIVFLLPCTVLHQVMYGTLSGNALEPVVGPRPLPMYITSHVTQWDSWGLLWHGGCLNGGHDPLRRVLLHCVIIADTSFPLFVRL